MFKQNLLGQKISSLQLSDSDLLKELDDIINKNYPSHEALSDAVQDKLTAPHIDSWKKGKAIPTNPIIRDALSILLSKTKTKGHFFELVLDMNGAKAILVGALNKYNNAIITNDLHEFKLKARNGDFDRIKNNPRGPKVTITDTMGCIAYLIIEGYLYGQNLCLKENEKLTISLYQQLIVPSQLASLVDSDQLLTFLHNELKKSGRINTSSLHKAALLYLLLTIKGDSFFKL